MRMNKEHKDLYKKLASVVSVANESRPFENPINFSNVQEVAYRELQVSNDEEKALNRSVDYVLALNGENLSYDKDLDLFPDEYLYNIESVQGKLKWLEDNTSIEPRQVALVASAVETAFDTLENLHAWARLEILKSTGEISEDLYNLTQRLEQEVIKNNDL